MCLVSRLSSLWRREIKGNAKDQESLESMQCRTDFLARILWTLRKIIYKSVYLTLDYNILL